MLIAGNLDVEVTWARMDAAARRARGENAPSPDDPRFALPEPVMRRISAAATLMRVAALNDSDRIWTPRPVDPSRMARVDWLPSPRLISGPVPETADVWWGEPTEVAAVLNHRSCIEEFRRSVPEYWLPGAALVRSIGELASHAARTARWVAKAPHSAAGRARVRGERGPLDPRAVAQATRLLELHGCLLFEPWAERIEDIGVAGEARQSWVDAGRNRIESVLVGAQLPHSLLVDAAGRFRGISTPRIHGDAGRAALAVGNVLAFVLGHRGSFGIDAYVVAHPDIGTRLVLCEVNVRRTFGHVANALASRHQSACGFVGDVPSLTLRFGRGAPPDGTLSLLLPGPDDDTSAWLEVPSRHAD